jgi:hypothetical protein
MNGAFVRFSDAFCFANLILGAMLSTNIKIQMYATTNNSKSADVVVKAALINCNAFLEHSVPCSENFNKIYMAT